MSIQTILIYTWCAKRTSASAKKRRSRYKPDVYKCFIRDEQLSKWQSWKNNLVQWLPKWTLASIALTDLNSVLTTLIQCQFCFLNLQSRRSWASRAHPSAAEERVINRGKQWERALHHLRWIHRSAKLWIQWAETQKELHCVFSRFCLFELEDHTAHTSHWLANTNTQCKATTTFKGVHLRRLRGVKPTSVLG